MLSALVDHRDLKAAEDIMDQTRQAGKTYVVSFNTLIKRLTSNEDSSQKGVSVDRRYEEGRHAAKAKKLQ